MCHPERHSSRATPCSRPSFATDSREVGRTAAVLMRYAITAGEPKHEALQGTEVFPGQRRSRIGPDTGDVASHDSGRPLRVPHRKLASWWASPRRVGLVTLLARFWSTTGTYDRVALET